MLILLILTIAGICVLITGKLKVTGALAITGGVARICGAAMIVVAWVHPLTRVLALPLLRAGLSPYVIGFLPAIEVILLCVIFIIIGKATQKDKGGQAESS